MENHTDAYYFAYGSNLNFSDLAQWCKKKGLELALNEKSATIAFLPDYYLAFTRYAIGRSGGVRGPDRSWAADRSQRCRLRAATRWC